MVKSIAQRGRTNKGNKVTWKNLKFMVSVFVVLGMLLGLPPFQVQPASAEDPARGGAEETITETSEPSGSENTADPVSAQPASDPATEAGDKDSDIGDLIEDVMDKMGKDGVVTVEESKGIIYDSETNDPTTVNQESLAPDEDPDRLPTNQTGRPVMKSANPFAGKIGRLAFDWDWDWYDVLMALSKPGGWLTGNAAPRLGEDIEAGGSAILGNAGADEVRDVDEVAVDGLAVAIAVGAGEVTVVGSAAEGTAVGITSALYSGAAADLAQDQ